MANILLRLSDKEKEILSWCAQNAHDRSRSNFMRRLLLDYARDNKCPMYDHANPTGLDHGYHKPQLRQQEKIPVLTGTTTIDLKTLLSRAIELHHKGYKPAEIGKHFDLTEGYLLGAAQVYAASNNEPIVLPWLTEEQTTDILGICNNFKYSRITGEPPKPCAGMVNPALILSGMEFELQEIVTQQRTDETSALDNLFSDPTHADGDDGLPPPEDTNEEP